ncbi:TPA: LOW QUALITY PROTEIN: hypothetical protein N0F65_002243 [Lagenidium giganteum]|uniref:Uncharacterized protein n=1 Tax=Lagenidium giganteum TaxID=4803 RepID=A0AAV2YWK2_9STRA|nr:TPA: LOW QUALITY PROTEIN: hypothetical protein N0F65_002243 [Lagenidium giganteum]
MTARGKKRVADLASSGDAEIVAQKLKAKRTNESTKRTYRSIMNVLVTWLHAHFPAAESGTVRLPADRDAVISFFGHICQSASRCDGDDESASSPSNTSLSVSCGGGGGYRSALVDAYREQGLTFDSSVDGELHRVLEGYEKLIDNLKKRGLIKISDAKRHLKWSGFTLLATKLFRQTPASSGQSTAIFTWAYFVLMWNLMSRDDSIDSIMLQHVEWADDCLVIEEQGHKAGADKFGKHVYANPYQPFTCPILAIAILLFSCPERSEARRQQLFLGTDNKNRFRRCMRRIFDGLCDDEQQILGCAAQDIESHSLRKGSSTYALGHVSGPNPAPVHLCMGQSLGKLKGRYIHVGKGVDQLCGRMIAGSFNAEKFGVLPPHFAPSLIQVMTTEYWNNIVSGVEGYPRGIKAAFPFFLASILHHEQYVIATLDPAHPIFKARVFTGNRLLSQQRGATVIAVGVSPCTDMRATGIPPHIACADQIKRRGQAVSDVVQELDILKARLHDTMPQRIASRVNFEIDGVVPLSLRDLDVRVAGLRSDIIAEIQRVVADRSPEATQTWRLWEWNDGRIARRVPPNWDFSSRLSVKTMWNLWHLGDANTGVRPYRLLDRQHDIKPAHLMRYTRVTSIAQELALVPVQSGFIATLPVDSADTIFQSAYDTAIMRMYVTTGAWRQDEITCGTVYNKLCTGMEATCGASVAFRRLPFRQHHRSFKRLPPPKKVRATQSVSTLAERVKILKWMKEADAHGTEHLFAATVRKLQSSLRGKSNANVTKSMPQERMSVVQHHSGGRKRVYIKSASGRKRSEWVTWLHKELLEEFVCLSKLGAKMTNGLILQNAVGILRNTTSEFNVNTEENCVAIVTKITPSWAQRFCERFNIVHRHQSGNLRVTTTTEETIEKEVATQRGEMKRLFERGILEDDIVTNMNEMHMPINIDNGVCLAFNSQESVSYPDCMQFSYIPSWPSMFPFYRVNFWQRNNHCGDEVEASQIAFGRISLFSSAYST